MTTGRIGGKRRNKKGKKEIQENDGGQGEEGEIK